MSAVRPGVNKRAACDGGMLRRMRPDHALSVDAVAELLRRWIYNGSLPQRWGLVRK